MARHEIPTHLDVEDHVLGPLTTRQTVYLLVGASAGYGIWTNPAIPAWARAALAGIIALVTLLVALVQIQGRPLEGWLLAALVYLARPRCTVWRSPPGRVARLQPEPRVRHRPYRVRIRWKTHPPRAVRDSAVH